ncbi:MULTISPECIES: TRAP transporter small permease [Roseobacteraceae]|jgi:TRAP-type C4-dicarboxylate transport system permease small subunit|uniref:TRAP transporter small permease protein n=1 Tax=Pseudosulfitobacter pseudonitzschiae TaxID=1402135 RepID=A0A221JZU6_9RHOB|nr:MULTISPECIES: TRAP transporter small permease [Roseobacteraceae]ASM72272.1 tripartite ATP-independent periplasmic transporter, DctQ component [Pseudosulfitobacter pseudonitzschiae]
MSTERRGDGNRIVGKIIQNIERVAGIMLGLVTVLIVVSAIGRYGFARPVPDVFDVSRLVLGIAIAWGLASLGFHGTHIKVDLLALSVPKPVQIAINGFAWLVLLGFTALLTWKIGERVMDAMGGGDVTMELRLAHWPFFAAIWLGMVAALFTTAVRLVIIVRDGRDLGEFDAFDETLLQDSDQK